VKPDLIRCHGARLNAYAARAIKRQLGIPYVVSLHINPDVDVRGGPVATAIIGRLYGAIEKESLLEADFILPVYRPILPFLRRIGATRYRVAYNVINPTQLRKKENYGLHRPVRVVSVGRLIAAKNPRALVVAAASLPDVELTIVGDGPIAGSLRRLANETGAGSRIIFRPTVRNDELCRELPNYDVFAVHTNYFELSKSVLEALLTGLPTIINRRSGEQVPELSDKFCLLVDNTADSYRAALERLITDDSFREHLGRAAHAHAREHWSPEKCEAEFVNIYRDLTAAHPRHPET
jgi:glycosyltransferase involved in cell wall biosynthesis